MLKGKKMMFGILSGLMLVTSCASTSTTNKIDQEEGLEHYEAESEPFLYENKDAGIKIDPSSNWTIEQEIYDQNLIVTFQYENLKAIVSVIPSEKTMKQIKKELQLGDGLITILEDTDDYYSFHTNQKEGIRSDVFIEHDHGRTLIVTFMSGLEEFENYNDVMEQFKGSITLTK